MKNKWLKIFLLSAFSCALLIAGFQIADFTEVVAILWNFPGWAVFSVIVVFILNVALISLRLVRLIQYSGFPLPYRIAARANLQGLFASLFFISLFGHMAGRQLALRRHGVPAILVALITMVERALLFLISGAACLLAMSLIFVDYDFVEFMADNSILQIALIIILILGLVTIFNNYELEKKLSQVLFSGRNLSAMVEASIISLISYLLVLSSFVIGGLAISETVDIWQLFAAAAVTSFAASLPISINGWGVRELTAIFTFGQLGIPAHEATAISLMVGLCSTAVILAAFPAALSPLQKDETGNGVSLKAIAKELPNATLIEQGSAWIVVTALAVLVFFQFHVQVFDGVLNVNLADVLTLLSLATVLMLCVTRKELPRWSVEKFNICLGVISLMIIVSFFNGYSQIGFTQWSFTGRLIGWVVVLGYISVALLVSTFLGRDGVKRFIEVLLTTSSVIVVSVVLLKIVQIIFLLDSLYPPYNFEGFSQNRNSFSFQLLLCLILSLTYFKEWGAPRRFSIPVISLSFDALHVVFGIILAGIVFTGSRSGLISLASILVFIYFFDPKVRRFLFFGCLFGVSFWLFSVLLPPVLLFSNSGEWTGLGNFGLVHNPIFSDISSGYSISQRIEIISRAYDLWKEYPWFGAGLGVFFEKSKEWFDVPVVIHSTPIWIVVEFGIIGALVFGLVLLFTTVSIVRNGLHKPFNQAAVLALIVFLLFGQVHEVFYQRMFWLVLGICVALHFFDDSEQTS